MTAEDLPHLAPEEGLCELFAGEIVREPWIGEERGKIAGSILGLVGRGIRDHRLARPPETLSRPDTLEGGSTVPGFRLPVREIFEG